MAKSVYFLLIFCACITISTNTFAQKRDSSALAIHHTLHKKMHSNFPDSIFKFNTRKPIAKRAGMYSAILPGLGQLYNKQYWKTGLVVAGAGVVSYFIYTNYQDYQKYQKAYINRIDNNPANDDTTFKERTTEDLNILRKGFRKYTEYSIIAGGVGYLLNILDAYVAAHLRSFDKSKDIGFHASPFYNSTKQYGVKISFCLP